MKSLLIFISFSFFFGNSFGQVPYPYRPHLKNDLGLQRIDHIGINISNLQQSANWYKKVFNFTLIHKWKSVWMIGNENIKIGLFEQPSDRRINEIDSSFTITHFAFSVDSSHFVKAQKFLKKIGVKFDSSEDTGIALAIFLYDPDGHQIEITTFHK